MSRKKQNRGYWVPVKNLNEDLVIVGAVVANKIVILETKPPTKKRRHNLVKVRITSGSTAQVRHGKTKKNKVNTPKISHKQAALSRAPANAYR